DIGVSVGERVPFNQFTGGTRETVYFGVRAYDGSGNVGESFGTYAMIPDNAPVIEIARPLPNAFFAEGGILGINVIEADDVLVDSVRFTVTDATGTTHYVDPQPPFSYG